MNDPPLTWTFLLFILLHQRGTLRSDVRGVPTVQMAVRMKSITYLNLKVTSGVE